LTLKTLHLHSNLNNWFFYSSGSTLTTEGVVVYMLLKQKYEPTK